MKKGLTIFVALFLALAVALPAFAVELKYGGLFRARLQSSENITDGNDDRNDNQNFLDQRLRMFFIFQSSENLKLVTGFEQDVLWGDSRNKVLTGHRDTVGLELKHAYLDFNIPNTPVNNRVGLLPIALLSGWIVDEDFTGALTTLKFDPVRVTLGYVSERNNDVIVSRDNIDDWVMSVDFANGPFKASAVFLYQDGHDNNGNFATNSAIFQGATGPFGASDHLFDLGLALEVKQPLFSVFTNFVKNLGSVDDTAGNSHDYTGWMVEAGGAFYCGPLTLNLGGFVTSGQSLDEFGNIDGDDIDNFIYPVGRSHYWSEIMGFGTLENTDNNASFTDAAGNVIPGNNIGDTMGNAFHGTYSSGDHPSNLWTVTTGAAFQVMEGTKLTLNYYYIGTTEEVISGLDSIGRLETSNDVGHELDFYLDQTVVDKLSLRLVAAYMFAGDALTNNVVFNGVRFENVDDDIYELGARLQWAF